MSARERDVLDFIVFLLHRVARSWGWSVPATYQALSSTDILNGYVVPCFDTLHSMGEQALVEDLTSFAREKGVLV